MKEFDHNLLPMVCETDKQISSDAYVCSMGNSQLSPILIKILIEVQRELALELSEKFVSTRSKQELSSKLDQVALNLGYELCSIERDEILMHLEKSQKNFGVLQELVDDQSVSDIIVFSYSKVSVQRRRKNYLTDIKFPCSEFYEAFVERLLARAGQSYSTRVPIVDAIFGTNVRIHAVHKVLCDSGPYLTLRLNRFSKVSCKDLYNYGLAPKEVFEYLAGLVLSGQTLLVAGEVGTGKTTLTRALAAEVPNDESILVIEDTPEIQLTHPQTRYLRTRNENSDGAGRVSPSECIRGGMRMAMNRIIFGEIRDAEAAEAFVDVSSSGHPGISTIHARSVDDALERLELFLGRAQAGVRSEITSKQVAMAVQCIVHLDLCRNTGVPRVMQIKELSSLADGVLRRREIFRYQLIDGLPTWLLVNKVSCFKEQLEFLPNPVDLHTWQSQLSLGLDVMYQEVSNGITN